MHETVNKEREIANWFIELQRYFYVSLIALMVDVGCFSLLFRVGNQPWWFAATCGFGVGAITAYVLSIRFVFRARRFMHAPHAEFASFALIGLFCLALTQFVLWVGIEKLHLAPELSKLWAVGMTFFSNYILRKFFLFRNNETLRSGSCLLERKL